MNSKEQVGIIFFFFSGVRCKSPKHKNSTYSSWKYATLSNSFPIGKD